MSRKKCTIDNNFFTRFSDLMGKLGYGKREQYKFADKLNISATYLSGILKQKKNPSFDIIYAIENNFPKVSIRWLLTGEGEMFRKGSDDTYIYKDTQDENPEVSELLKMTREIMESETDYAASLGANIRSFHKSVQMESEIHDLKGRVQNHEKRIALVEKINPGGSDPLAGNPCEKKDTGT